jgi:hypothetical protein
MAAKLAAGRVWALDLDAHCTPPQEEKGPAVDPGTQFAEHFVPKSSAGTGIMRYV